jgi:hypothetical protein
VYEGCKTVLSGYSLGLTSFETIKEDGVYVEYRLVRPVADFMDLTMAVEVVSGLDGISVRHWSISYLDESVIL